MRAYAYYTKYLDRVVCGDQPHDRRRILLRHVLVFRAASGCAEVRRDEYEGEADSNKHLRRYGEWRRRDARAKSASTKHRVRVPCGLKARQGVGAFLGLARTRLCGRSLQFSKAETKHFSTRPIAALPGKLRRTTGVPGTHCRLYVAGIVRSERSEARPPNERDAHRSMNVGASGQLATLRVGTIGSC